MSNTMLACLTLPGEPRTMGSKSNHLCKPSSNKFLYFSDPAHGSFPLLPYSLTMASPTPATTDTQKKNRIQVSNTKKPLFFYVNLAKRYIQQHNEVELSALGMAIATVVTVGEILKNSGLATEKKILKDENRGRLVQKAKIELVLGKSDKFDKTELEAAVSDKKR